MAIDQVRHVQKFHLILKKNVTKRENNILNMLTVYAIDFTGLCGIRLSASLDPERYSARKHFIQQGIRFYSL